VKPEVHQLIAAVQAQPGLSPVTRQVYINRLVHTPTEAEIKFAREQVAGRITSLV